MTDRAALLDRLLADPRHAAGIPHEEVVALLGQMAVVQAVLLARLVAEPRAPEANPPPPVPPDRLLTVEEAAEYLGMDVRMVYRRAHFWPFTRKVSPRALRFSERGLREFLAVKPLDGGRDRRA